MRRILVGIDGTLESRRAAHYAANLAQSGHKDLVFASVLPGPFNAGPFQPQYKVWRAELMQRRKRELSEIAGLEQRADAPIEMRFLDGDDAAETLARVAGEDDQVELVVVGHRDRSQLSRLLAGSVADRLVQICQKPVMVVH